MKKTMLTLATLVSIGTMNAQTIEVKEGSDKFSTGTQNSLSTTILENSKDDVESEWKSLLKDFKNEKVKSDKGELFADNVIIKEWGNKARRGPGHRPSRRRRAHREGSRRHARARVSRRQRARPLGRERPPPRSVRVRARRPPQHRGRPA